jgi:cytochrome c-type biogenesis protein CcmF
VLWLWVGGILMAFGTLLAAFPGRRRDPTDPVSAPVPDDASWPATRSGAPERAGAAEPAEPAEPAGVS